MSLYELLYLAIPSIKNIIWPHNRNEVKGQDMEAKFDIYNKKFRILNVEMN